MNEEQAGEEGLGDARLRDAYAQAVALRREQSRSACASPDALLAVVRREGREDIRLATLDHALACPDCGRELELLRSIERAGGAATHRVAQMAIDQGVRPDSVAKEMKISAENMQFYKEHRKELDAMQKASKSK